MVPSNSAQNHHVQRGRNVIGEAATSVLCEKLECRWLLSTHSWTIDQTTAHSIAYLQPGSLAGQVQVRLDDPATGSIDHIFSNQTGMDIINCGTFSGFIFVDQVHTAQKPTTDGTDDGLKVQGGSGGTLRIEAGSADTLIQLLASAPTSATVKVTDSSSNIGYSRFGNGVTNLTFRTNGYAAGFYYPNGGTKIDVASSGYPALSSSTLLRIETGAGTHDMMNLGANANNELVPHAEIYTGAGYEQVNLGSDADDTSEVTVDFGAGTGTNTNHNLGLGNELNVNGFATAVLNQIGGTSHTIVLDTVNVQSGGILIVSDDATIGDLNVGIYSSASIEAPTLVAGTFTVDGDVTFTGPSNPSTVQQFTVTGGNPAGSAATVVVDSGADVSILGGSAIPNITVDGIAEFVSGSSTVNKFLVADDDPENATGEVDVDSGAAVTILRSSAMGVLNAPGTGTITL
jgi:hypothetical protein